MAHSYFKPQRSGRQHSASASHSDPDATSSMSWRQERENLDESLTGDLEQSIFIFPSPLENAMMPADILIPTSRAHEQQTGRGRRVSNASRVTSDWCSVSGHSGRSASVGSLLPSPLVEVWEMSDEGDSASQVEPEIEGYEELGRAFTFEEIIRRRQQQFPLSRQPQPNQFCFEDGRFQFRGRRSQSSQRSRSRSARRLLRTRTRSRSQRRASSSLPSSSELSRATSTLPLLHLLSYLLSVNDSTYDLLTRPSSHADSPLFAGHRLQPVSEESVSSEQLVVHEDALLLLAGAKQTPASPQLSEFKAASESLKAGIEATMDDSSATPASPFALPNPYPLFTLPFTYLWRSVGSVFMSPSTKSRMQEASVPS